MNPGITPFHAFSLIETLALAALGILVGKGLTRFFPTLSKLCLPEPVLGGLLLCFGFTLAEVVGGLTFTFDLALQTPLMIAFFLSIGWMASWRNLKAGGPQVVRFLILCSVILLVQNAVGMTLATSLGQHPLLGVLAGSVSLTGGPGTALAFSPAFEKAGVIGAGPIGTACALLGIVMGGLLGAPLTSRLMSRHGLKGSGAGQPAAAAAVSAAAQEVASHSVNAPQLDPANFMRHMKFFLIVMALGATLGKWIQGRGITLPIYIGAMIVAALIRNWHDRPKKDGKPASLEDAWIEEIGSAALSYFLVLATLTLRLSQLSSLAGTLMLILAVQAVVVWVIASQVVYRLSGKDYDAAVMGGGFVGFMLGTTANAMANMEAVTRRYGPAPRAYLVVPLVGACFVDFVNATVITLCLQFFGSA